METKADMEDYLEDLLDKSNPNHQKFIQDLIKRWLPKSRSVADSVPNGAVVGIGSWFSCISCDLGLCVG